MNDNEVIMSNWHNIWNKRIPDETKLNSSDIEEKFMELKRLTGNDTLKNGGVAYDSFIRQYKRLKEMLSAGGNNLTSWFEVGCGSGPYLMLLEHEGCEVGGMDYASNLIKAAQKALKSPKELYCDEALNLDTEIKYDAVFSTSAFEYFETDEYAATVLSKMLQKARYSVAVLDVHDEEKQEEYVTYRRSVIENYDELYKGLTKKFFPKEFFIRYAQNNNLKIVIENSCLDGYWNQPFVYDVYFYKESEDK
jgi:hypothetical protein